MFLDSATLRDLEIVPTPPLRGVTLWSLLNRTRTRVGAEALRAHLLNPPHEIPKILALQQAHQAMSHDATTYREVLDSAAADPVERHLNLSWQFPETCHRSVVLVASHVAEVVSAIRSDPRIAFFYFAADATGDDPQFDYSLREGVSEQRLGMTLLRREGVLSRLERSTLTAGDQV